MIADPALTVQEVPLMDNRRTHLMCSSSSMRLDMLLTCLLYSLRLLKGMLDRSIDDNGPVDDDGSIDGDDLIDGDGLIDEVG